MTTDQSWEGLKREARTLEALLDSRIQAYGSGAAPSRSAPRPAGAAATAAARDEEAGMLAGDSDAAAAKEIEDALERFVAVTDKLGHLLAERPSKANAATVQRYREVQHDFKAAYRRQQAAARTKRDSAALFNSLRAPPGGRAGDHSVTDALLRERSGLSSSSSALDSVLAQAAETRDALARQRAGIVSAAGRLGSLAATLPGVAQLMGAIDARRARNDTVVGLTVAGCLCFLLYWFALRAA